MNLRGEMPPRTFILQSLLLIAIVCGISYANTLHVPFHFDDIENIIYRTYVMNIDAFFDPVMLEKFNLTHDFRIRKVGFFTFALNYMIHGDDVVGYHIVNIAIHMLNGFLVYFLVLLTFKTPYFRKAGIWYQGSGTGKGKSLNPNPQPPVPAFISLFVALLFVSHPIQTQAVTYIVQRLASLATLFYLLSLVMFIKWRLSSNENNPTLPPLNLRGGQEGLRVQVVKRGFVTSTKRFFLYAVSFISAALAMKTKEIAFTLPLVITLYEFMFFGGALKKKILYLAPLLLTILIIPLELKGLERPAGTVMGEMDNAVRASSDMSRWDYLFTQFRVIVTYIRLLFFPMNQNLDYDYPIYHSFFDPNVILSFLFLSAILGFGIYCLYRSRITHHALRLTAFGIFWFFITLSVESSIIPIKDVIFEHRLYLPSVGFFIAVTAVLSMAWERVTNISKRWAKITLGAFGLIIVIFSGATYARNNLWLDEVSFWQDVINESPSKIRGRVNLGYAYSKQGRFDQAIREFQTALKLDPDDYQLYSNLGVAYKGQGRNEEAILEFQKALRLKPDDGLTYYNLGNIYREQGAFEEAVKHYQVAARLEPDIPVIHNNLGIAYIGVGNLREAEREFRIALAIDPKYEAVKRNLEMLLRSGGG